MNKLTRILATGLGLGYCPVASGTAGTLLGIPIAAAMAPLSLSAQIVVAAVLVVVAVPVCGVAEDGFGKKDDGRIVADEYLSFPICLLGLPWLEHWWLLGLAFVVHRALDVIKPPPARQAQALRGGVGIVVDDVISSLYALGVNHAVWWGVSRFLG